MHMDTNAKISESGVDASTSNKNFKASVPKPQHIPQAGYGGTSEQALDKVLGLLQEKDDTSRLVGLTLLKPLLDNNAQFREPRVIGKCWKAVPLKFIIRLLRSTTTEKMTKEEASNCIGIAVGVIRSFLCLSDGENTLPLGLATTIPPLQAALAESSEEMQCQIAEILSYFLYDKSGLAVMWRSTNWTKVLYCALHYKPALGLLVQVFQAAAVFDYQDRLERIHQVIENLVSRARNPHEISNVFEFCDTIFSFDFVAERNSRHPPQWLSPLTDLIHKTVLYVDKETPNSAKACSATGSLTATLLNRYRVSFSSLLFCSTAKEARLTFFDNVIIEIRSSIPSLQGSLYTPEYPARSAQLEACYNVLSNFISFLIETWESDVENGTRTTSSTRRLGDNVADY